MKIGIHLDQKTAKKTWTKKYDENKNQPFYHNEFIDCVYQIKCTMATKLISNYISFFLLQFMRAAKPMPLDRFDKNKMVFRAAVERSIHWLHGISNDISPQI